MYKKRHDIAAFLEGNAPVVRVRVEDARGSTPRARGTWMLVSHDRIFKTIGGGQLEKLAIDAARDMLRTSAPASRQMNVPLGPDIGQCCGGSVTLGLDLLDADGLSAVAEQVKRRHEALPSVLVFGAGHVGIALCEALALLPVNVTLIDSREEELAAAPDGVDARLAAVPEAIVDEARTGSAFVILTHEHAQDFLVARRALERGDAAYVGMIGSATKRATFVNWLKRDGGDTRLAEALVCPIGQVELVDKRPEVIAALTVAEIISRLGMQRHGIAGPLSELPNA